MLHLSRSMIAACWLQLSWPRFVWLIIDNSIVRVHHCDSHCSTYFHSIWFIIDNSLVPNILENFRVHHCDSHWPTLAHSQTGTGWHCGGFFFHHIKFVTKLRLDREWSTSMEPRIEQFSR